MRQVNAQTIRQGFVEFVARQPSSEDVAGGAAVSPVTPEAEAETEAAAEAVADQRSSPPKIGGSLGKWPGQDLPITETVLLRGGAFCGRRLQYCGWQLVWFMEEHQVKLWRPDGELHACYDEQQFIGELPAALPRAA
jgi:hypothetical protein